MKLTRAAEYAIRCILYLAKEGQGQLVCKKEIAENAEIPPHFLAKIAQDLAKAGFIGIKQGARGGFYLLKKPESITLLDIVETMIGEIYLNNCVALPSSCNMMDTCTVHSVWVKASNQLRKSLREVTFDQLTGNKTCIPGSDSTPTISNSNE